MAALGGRAYGVPSLSLSSYVSCNSKARAYTHSMHLIMGKLQISRLCISCSALQESSSSTATAETKATEAMEKMEVKAAEAKAPTKAAASKAKPAKAPAKPLPEMMEQDVIPPLKAILEAQQDISEIELSFKDNKLEGSFVQSGIPYSFWAFFPSGSLTGPRGFSLSSHGSEASTVEPFLIDEKKITARHVIFWVEKRLAAQGILPVWKE